MRSCIEAIINKAESEIVNSLNERFISNFEYNIRYIIPNIEQAKVSNCDLKLPDNPL